MAGRVGGCIGRLLLIGLLVVLAAAAWLFHEPLLGLLEREPPTEAASPELAERAAERLSGLGRGSTRIALSGAELQSLVTYRWRPLPGILNEPRVRIQDGRVRLDASVPTARFAGLAELRTVADFLPDTADVGVSGHVVPLRGGRVAIEVHDVTAAHVPVPDGLVPVLLERLGRRDEPGLSPNALAVALPRGVDSAYVSGDSLVLVSRDD